MIKPKPIIGRVGGKVRLAPWIIEHLKRFQWSIFVEPFCGSGAVYFRLIQEGIFEQIRLRGHHPRIVLNDADSRIIQLFKTCRDHPELLAYAVAMTPYSREEHKLAQQSIDGIEDEIEQARRYLCDHYQSFNHADSVMRKAYGRNFSVWGCNQTDDGRGNKFPQEWHSLPQRILAAAPHLQGDPNPIDSRQCLNEVGQAFVEPSIDARVEMARRYLVQGWQSFKKDTTVSSDGWRAFTSAMQSGGNHVDCPGEWHTIPQRILTATEHLKKCYIENDDAVKCIERWATPHTAIYADPPYVNAEGYYQVNAKAGKDANLEMHHRLAATLNTIEASAVIVSYYPNELLDELYPEENWERHYKDTVASSAGITRNSKTRTRPKRTELLLVRKSKGDNPVVNLSGQMSLL